jgi:tRNA(Ile)-lysidine synthase
VGGPDPRLTPVVGSVGSVGAVGAEDQVRLAVRAALRDREADEAASPVAADGGCVVVGVSGGADSLALLAATVHVAGPLHLRVHAVCVDHGWHRRTRLVASAVARACLLIGADDVRVVRVVPRGGGGAEDAARTVRLAALTAAAERDGARAVLLGHTLDDQAEQVLLALARGSGARALAGIPARRGLLLRPLLGLRRDVVRAACPRIDAGPVGVALPWDDPSNDEHAHLRARVRARLLPELADVLGPGSVEGLARSADLLRADDEALTAWASREVVLLLEPDGGTGSSVDVPVAPLTGLPTAVRTRVLRLLAAGAGAGALTLVHTRALDALVTDWHGQGGVALPGGVTAHRAKGDDGCGRLRIAAARPPREDSHGRP